MRNEGPIVTDEQLKSVNISMRHAIHESDISLKFLGPRVFYSEASRTLPSRMQELIVTLARGVAKLDYDAEGKKHAVLKGLLGGLAISHKALEGTGTYDSMLITVDETLNSINGAVKVDSKIYSQIVEGLGAEYVATYANTSPSYFRLLDGVKFAAPIDQQRDYANSIGLVGSIATSRLVQYTVFGD